MDTIESTMPLSSSASQGLGPCCLRTLEAHATNNPMMVCGECKQIIKYFEDERAFNNYTSFCASRSRPISTAKYKDLYVVMFRSFDNFTK